MHGFIPDFGPRPLCVGRYKSNPDVHFYLAEFVDLVEDVVPGPEQYMEAVIALHTRSVGKSPDGKFGFSTHTAYGDILQNNEWESSWEAFYTRVMKDAFDIEERNRDTHDEKLTNLKKSFFEKVIPRYLRPLESDGRSVKPTWCIWIIGREMSDINSTWRRFAFMTPMRSGATTRVRNLRY